MHWRIEHEFGLWDDHCPGEVLPLLGGAFFVGVVVEVGTLGPRQKFKVVPGQYRLVVDLDLGCVDHESLAVVRVLSSLLAALLSQYFLHALQLLLLLGILRRISVVHKLCLATVDLLNHLVLLRDSCWSLARRFGSLEAVGVLHVKRSNRGVKLTSGCSRYREVFGWLAEESNIVISYEE